MTVKLYFSKKTRELKKAENFLQNENIAYEKKCILTEKLEYEQFLEMLQYTDNGVIDIVSIRSSAYKSLKNSGKLEHMKLKELYYMIRQQPSLLATPLIVGKYTTIKDVSEEKLSVLLNRDVKNKSIEKVLKKMHSIQIVETFDDELIKEFS